jgi:hypothetical protein
MASSTSVCMVGRFFYGAYKVSASDAPVLSGTSATYQLFSLCIIDIILLIGLTAYLYTFRKRKKTTTV